MPKNNLEQRVAVLEADVAQLKAALERVQAPKDWRRTIGMFAGDEIMKQIDEEARKYREADRRRAGSLTDDMYRKGKHLESSTMARATLEQRVAALEDQVQQLKATLESGEPGQDWRRTAGMFTDNPGMKQLFADAMKLREADRAKARKKRAKAKSHDPA
jgi:hypothetical protein